MQNAEESEKIDFARFQNRRRSSERAASSHPPCLQEDTRENLFRSHPIVHRRFIASLVFRDDVLRVRTKRD